MRNPELERSVREGIQQILAEHGEHLDFAARINKLRSEGIGREVRVKINLEHERKLEWPAGIILPIKNDNTRHAVFLANDRVVVVKGPAEQNDLEEYKQFMSPSKRALAWTLPESHDLSHVEDYFMTEPNLVHAKFVRSGSSSEQATTVNWAIHIARGMKYGKGTQ